MLKIPPLLRQARRRTRLANHREWRPLLQQLALRRPHVAGSTSCGETTLESEWHRRP